MWGLTENTQGRSVGSGAVRCGERANPISGVRRKKTTARASLQGSRRRLARRGGKNGSRRSLGMRRGGDAVVVAVENGVGADGCARA